MVRLAEEKDIREILEIYRPYVENTTVSFEWEMPSLEAFRKRFQKITEEFAWLVYEVEGRIAGYAYAERAFERKAYQWSADLAVYIHREYHHMGIGRSLYKAVEELLKQQGYVNVYALVTQYNQKSIDFHKAVGYTEVARFPNIGFKMDTWLDVIWLQKVLQQYEVSPKEPRGIETIAAAEVEAILAEAAETKSPK